MKISEAKIGCYYGIKKTKSVIVPQKKLENGRISVLNLVTNNTFDIKPDYEVDGELTKVEAEALLALNETVQVNKSVAEGENAKHKAYQKKKKEGQAPKEKAVKAAPVEGEAPAAGAAEDAPKRVMHAPKDKDGLGKCALIDRRIIEGGHTLDEIVEIVSKELGVTDDAGKKAIKSTAGVRPVHVKKQGYEVIKDEVTKKLSVKKLS